jgi:hypothetical protein
MLFHLQASEERILYTRKNIMIVLIISLINFYDLNGAYALCPGAGKGRMHVRESPSPDRSASSYSEASYHVPDPQRR